MEREGQNTLLLERLRARLQNGSLQLPVMPTIAAEVQQSVARPGSSARALSELIEIDAGMAARIVRIANSAMFAGLSEARDLSFAIARLGSSMVVSIVLGAAAKDLFQAPDPSLCALLEEAWERSLLAAAAGRQMSGMSGAPAEEAFLGGLLHSIGDPVVVAALTPARGEEGVTAEEMPEDVLRRILEELRPQAGAALLEHWQMPPALCRAVAHQHREPLSRQDGLELELTVAAAARLARIELLEPGSSPGHLVNHAAFRAIGGDRAQAIRLTQSALQEFHELARLF